MSTFLHPHSAHRADRCRELPLAVAVTCLLALAFLYQSQIERVADVAHYGSIGQQAMTASLGGDGELQSEYPPLATVLFMVANAVAWGGDVANAWLCVVVVGVMAAAAYARRGLGDTHAWLIPASVAGTAVLAGPEIVFGRYDVLVALSLLLSVRSRALRRYGHAGLFLAVACALKMVPVLLLPAMLATAAPGGRSRLAWGFVAGLAGTIAVTVMVLGLGPALQNIRYVAEYHGPRAIQIESLWSGMHLAVKALAGQRAAVGTGHLSMNNTELGTGIATIVKVLVPGLALAASAIAMRNRRRETDTLTLGVLVLAVALSPVFSPQYVVWFLPLLPAWALDRLPDERHRPVLLETGFLGAVIAVATQWVFPLHYPEVIAQETLALVVLNVRNGAVLLLAVVLLRQALSGAGLPHPARQRRFPLRRLTLDVALLTATLLALSVTHRPSPAATGAEFEFADGQRAETPSEPYTADGPEGDVRVTLALSQEYRDGRVYLAPAGTGCVTALAMNEAEVPLEEYCGEGRRFDLAALMQPEDNRLAVSLRHDGGGAAGVTLLPAALPPLAGAFAAWVLVSAGMTLHSVLAAALAAFLHRGVPPPRPHPDLTADPCAILVPGVACSA